MERLVKETAWSRVYEAQDGSRINRSKFRADGVSVTFEEVRRSWPQWNENERLDFAQAFSVKTEFTADDCRILEFLVKEGSEVVASHVAEPFASCSRNQLAFDLIMSRLRGSVYFPRSSFFQALARLGDDRAIPVLEEFHETLVEDIAKVPRNDVMIDYLSCCTALAVLTRNVSYKREVEAYLKDQREVIREWATTMLRLKLGGL